MIVSWTQDCSQSSQAAPGPAPLVGWVGPACRRAPIGSLLLAWALASGIGADKIVMCGV
jgi:hypothetical protein